MAIIATKMILPPGGGTNGHRNDIATGGGTNRHRNNIATGGGNNSHRSDIDTGVEPHAEEIASYYSYHLIATT